MEPIPKSGYYYPNKFALRTLNAFEQVMGKDGLNAVLERAHLSHLVDNYPPDSLERAFDFADYTAINPAVEEMYGPRGGRGMAMRAGRTLFAETLRTYGALAGTGAQEFQDLPLSAKLRISLPTTAKIFSQISDQHTTVDEDDDHVIYTVHRCPVCWGRSDVDKPVCFITVGLLREALKWISGGREFRVNESKCIAIGDEVCEFIIQKAPIGQ